MKLLIVDDEFYSVENLRNKLDWANIGFKQVFCAYSMAQAQKIFAQEQIDIMLCDIEMPQGSGLDLLEWVRNQGLNTVCIFLTCYAKFDYASEAIHLGSSDYLLKPIESEALHVAINRAVEQVRLMDTHQINALHADYWASTATQRAQQFWFQTVDGGNVHTRAEVARELRAYHLPFALLEKAYCPILLDCVVTEAAKRWETNVYQYAIMNILQEVFFTAVTEESDNLLTVTKLTQNQYFIPLPLYENRNLILRQCWKALDACTTSLPGIFQFFVGKPCHLEQTGEICLSLKQAARETVVKESNVLDVITAVVADGLSAAVPAGQWGDMLLEHRFDDLRQEIESYLLRLSQQKQARRRHLMIFYHDFSQVFYAHLERNGAAAHQLFDDPMLVALSEKACDSIQNMTQWATRLLEAYTQYADSARAANTVIEEVRQYIRDHLADELSRNELASAVYLSPDYLSHLFPEKMGVSLTAYITGERIRRAKELLMRDEMSVRDVALASGFQNISYFSKQFKRITGLTPQEFRKRG